MQDITLIDALNLIFALLLAKIREIDNISKENIDQIYDVFIGIVIEKFNLKSISA